MIEELAQVVFAVGRVSPSGIQLLGTAFVVAQNKLATAAHVTGIESGELVLILNKINKISGYQDTSDNSVQTIKVNVIEHNAVQDIAILQAEQASFAFGYSIEGSDSVATGQSVYSLGFPHADHGRLVLTTQSSFVGARVLIEASGIKSKHIILNTQTRPGQSGGPVFRADAPQIVAMIMGSYAPGSAKGGISLGGIDPQTLHQTTHAISAEYIASML